MSDSVTVTKRIHFSMAHRGRREIEPGPQPVRDTPNGRVPRVSRLMALAIRFDHLLADGAVRDQAELAELGHVTPARVTQIMNFLHLAPDIQTEILFLPPVIRGRDPVTERHLRPIAAEADWARQREVWKKVSVGS
jgi:hypothetical protein